jgi:glycosyltransferase involved in cell wall biosynthesis
MSGILNLIESSGPGGAESIMLTLANYQHELGFESTVCLQKEGWVSNRVNQLGLKLLLNPLKSSIDFLWLKKMYQYVKNHDIKLIHSHEFAMNFHGTLLSQISGVPCITTVHGKKYYPDKWSRRFIYRYISKHSNLVAVSDDLKQFLVSEIEIKDRLINVLPNGVNIDDFKPSDLVRTETRLKLGITDDQVLIGAVGNLYPVKGHTFLIDAAALVCKEYPQTVFMIAGRGQLEQELKEQAAQLGIENNILFLGFRDDVHRLLQAMDVFVMSSLSEGLPVSILEAMASRTPVVSTDVGGIPEVIIHNETGYLMKSGSAESLAEGLLTCLTERAQVNGVIDRAFEFVEGKHSLHTMLNEYEVLYRKLI